MIAAATSEVEHLRATIAALDCSLALILISGKDRVLLADQLTKRQLINLLVYFVARLEEVRNTLAVVQPEPRA